MTVLNESQLSEALLELQGWEYQNGSIVRSYKFKDFKETFAIMTRIAFECEAQNHHPEWENVYNSLTIKLNTHDAGGVTQKDLDLAKKIESLILS